MIPRFFADMPPRKAGTFEACVIHETRGREFVVRSVVVKGFRRAYIVARILAFLDDLLTPDFDGELGIKWGVRSRS